MQRSTKKILTTHVGSLPEPPGLDSDERLTAAVADIIRRQREIGLDIVNEGEYTKRGDWLSYVGDVVAQLELVDAGLDDRLRA